MRQLSVGRLVRYGDGKQVCFVPECLRVSVGLFDRLVFGNLSGALVHLHGVQVEHAARFSVVEGNHDRARDPGCGAGAGDERCLQLGYQTLSQKKMLSSPAELTL